MCLILSVILPLSLCSCDFNTNSGKNAAQPPDADNLSSVTVTLDFFRQSGYASNQFAVWIESESQLVKTLYATRYTANGGYKQRPDSIPDWVSKSGLSEMTKAQVDAVTSATPKSGSVSYIWDLTDRNGEPVPPGEYTFVVEGSLRWKNRVVYSGVIDTGGEAVTVQAEAEYFYEGSDGQAALTADSPENTMITNVSVSFTPVQI
jgi:hypothetical protein